MRITEVLDQIDSTPTEFIGELHGAKVYGTVAGVNVYDVYVFPIQGGPDLQITREDLTS